MRPGARRTLLGALTGLGLTVAATSPAAAAERCGAPVVAGGQPALVVVLADGITSQQLASGSSDPLAVPNWCPALPDGAERRYPAGIDLGLRIFAGLAKGDGTNPQTTSCRPEGGLGTDACLVARLADAGAVLLPYSYVGARVDRDAATGRSRFTYRAYAPDDTTQPPSRSVAALDEQLRSIQVAWPAAKVLVVAHSYGGTIATGWWETRAPANLGRVAHVVTMDSPVNGIEQCRASAFVFSQDVGDEFCRRWENRDAYSASLLARNVPQTLTTIGTPNDPTYDPPVSAEGGAQVSGGGRLRSQVLYRCADEGVDPRSACLAAPSTVVNTEPACDGRGPGVFGRTGHFVVMACPNTTRTILARAAIDAVVAPRRGGGGVERPRALRIGRLRVDRITWTSWGGARATGTGRVRGIRRTVSASTLRPCDAARRVAYRRVQVAGAPAERRGCPG